MTDQQYLDLVNAVLENRDEQAFEQIHDSLKDYIKQVAAKYVKAGFTLEDFQQEALFALTAKIIPEYSLKKGNFLSYAKLWIRRHLITIVLSKGGAA